MARIGRGIRAIAPTVVVMCTMGSQAAGGSAREPAVSELNVSVMGFYLGGERLESEPAFSDPTSWNDTGGVSAELTLPLGDLFGNRSVRVGVGVSLSIALPGSDDLKQLFRELPI